MKKPKIDLEAKWAENVQKAKEFCAQKSLNQMMVAKLALEVCEITWGGYHTDHKFTLKRFAQEVGVGYKSVSTWCAVRRTVYEKLPADKRDSVSFTKLHHVASRLGRDAPVSHVLEKFEEMTGKDSLENRMLRCLADLRSASYNFAVNNAAEKLSVKTLEEFMFYGEKITGSIRKAKRGIKGKDHGLCSQNNLKAMSAAQALGIPRGHTGQRVKVKDGHGEINITPKDRDIIQFIQKKDRFWSPTEIGMKLKGHKRDSASAWAYRTLNKLQSLGAVERNTKGLYRWIGLPKAA